MLDKSLITSRFFSCHEGLSRTDIGKIYGVKRVTVVGWAKRNKLSWSKLKYFVDSQAISWDWILEGVGEKTHPAKKPINRRSKSPKFKTDEINSRFLSLFDGLKQTEIAAKLGVTSAAVSEWKYNLDKVPWEKLAYAVDKFSVRWDWLIDGSEPKYRDSDNEDVTV